MQNVKKRLDIWIFEQGLAESREKAKAMIMAGVVFVDNQLADKPGNLYQETQTLEVRGKTLPYVSRGGLKLEKSLQAFNLSLLGLNCLDIGASTGGFTDCMLQNGAKSVCAVDVGYGQLAWKLRIDPRVRNLERTNARYLRPELFDSPIEFASVDVSFISLALIFPALYAILDDQAYAVCLVKPQFEAGREFVGKKGVVRDPKVHEKVLEAVVDSAMKNCFSIIGVDFSPVKGPEGNIEFLLCLQKAQETVNRLHEGKVASVVLQSHQKLGDDS